MSVILYTGLMGSGKSYSAIENVVLSCLKEGRTIVTNMVLQKAVIYADFENANITTIPDSIEYEQRAKYFNLDHFPAGAVFIIDEAGELFPSGERQSLVPQSLKQFFTKHRHSVGQDGKSSEIVLMTQNAGQLASWVRDLVDTQYDHVKLDKHGMSKTFRCDIYDRAHTGSKIPQNALIKSAVGTYKPEVFKYYKSHTQNKSEFESGLEVKSDDRGNFLGVYRNAVIAFIFVFFAIWLGYKSLTGMFTVKDENKLPSDTLPGEVPTVIKDKKKEISTQALHDLISSELPFYKSDPLLQVPNSEKYKLVGRIQTPRGLFIMIRSQHTTYNLKARDSCSYRQTIRDWVCILDGELIAEYTGPIFTDNGTNENNDSSALDFFD